MKKILIVFAFVFCSAVLAPHSFAATDPVPLSPTQSGFVPLAGIPGLTQGGAADSSNLADFFNNLYKYLIGLAAVLAVIEIIWGGLEISTQDSISKQKEGKKRIQDAIFGLVLVLSPVLVFSIINPSILNLSLNLQKLDLATPTPTPPTQVRPDQFGCTDNTQCTAGYQCVGFIQGKSAGTCRSTQTQKQPATIKCGFTQEADCLANSDVCTWVVTPGRSARCAAKF